MTLPVAIDLACNDPDSGLFAGRIQGVQIYYRCGDPLVELEPRTTRAPLLTRLGEGRLRISGKSWPIVGSKEWFGNWCWNRYWFDRGVAADLLIWMQARDLFVCSTGELRIFNAWKWRGRLQAFRGLILAQLAEAA